MVEITPTLEPSAETYSKVRPVNPYRIAAGLILDRLLWDLSPQSWRSRAQMKRLYNSHKGEKAVILCTGPSLNRVDFQTLKETYCFGLNKIHLLFPRTDFRPSSIVATAPAAFEGMKDFLNTTEIPLFLGHKGMRWIRPRPSHVFFHEIHAAQRFARTASSSIVSGGTVTFVALQLAYLMGFTKIALVGCDNAYQLSAQQAVGLKVPYSDNDHFDRSYNADKSVNLSHPLERELSYALAYSHFEADGRLLVNATDGGALESLPRMTLSEFLAL